MSDVEALPVSVVIPAHNRAAMLERALASVWAQRPRPPAEVIVVDDASTDVTADVAERLGARVLRHTANRGAAAARNTGFRAARQPWVALLDSDDEWLPHHLATLWPLRGDRVLVAGAALVVTDEPAPVRYHGVSTAGPHRVGSPAELWPENFLPASAVIVRRDVVLEVGGLREDLGYAEDLDLWVRVIERGSALAVPEVVALWHRHGGSKSRHDDASRAAQRRIVALYDGRPWFRRDVLERQLAFRAWDASRAAWAAGDRRTAAREIAWFIGPPSRLNALRVLLWKRLRNRQRGASFTPAGDPTVALLRGAAAPSVADGTLVDLRGRSTFRALLALLHRPTARADAGTLAGRLALRLLRIPPP